MTLPPKPPGDEGAEFNTPEQAFILKREALQMGKVGIWFGTGENAALYLTAGLVFLLLIVLVIAMIFEPSVRVDIIKIFTAAFFAGMGFIGGLIARSK